MHMSIILHIQWSNKALSINPTGVETSDLQTRFSKILYGVWINWQFACSS